ncbi:MAG: GDP-mannose 4,6-dehydratase [Nanoarchaeota archaeon]
MGNKRALIIGVLGMDGSYLAELLYSKGYDVYGFVRHDPDLDKIHWLKDLIPNIKIYHVDLSSKKQLLYFINHIHPDEIYNFAGKTDTFSPYENIDESIQLNINIPVNILEAIVMVDEKIKFFQASSCLIFGNDTSGLQNELTIPNPIYPYGITKLAAQNFVKMFREHFGLFACSGIFFPHESPRRGEKFFSKKVCISIAKIKSGVCDKIKIGSLGDLRDWSYSPDVIEAVYLMLQNREPVDFVIGSGIAISTKDFIYKSLVYAGIINENESIEKYIEINNHHERYKPTSHLICDNSKIKKELGWVPKHSIDDIIKIMIDFEINSLKT